MPSEKEPPASFPRLTEPGRWLKLARQLANPPPSIKVQFKGGRKIETTFDSRGRPVERQTFQMIGPMPGPAQYLPENPYLRQ